MCAIWKGREREGRVRKGCWIGPINTNRERGYRDAMRGCVDMRGCVKKVGDSQRVSQYQESMTWKVRRSIVATLF